MKNSATPTQKGIALPPGAFIVSKTDLKGRIIYCNRIFMSIAGYDEKDLLGKQHNIIRHPDMPRAVFHRLWKTVEAGDEFVGFVKNMCLNGDHYWVLATVSAVTDSRGNTTGYSSIRRNPSDQALSVIEPIYREMKAIEERTGSRNGIEAADAYLNEQLKQQSYDEFVFSL